MSKVNYTLQRQHHGASIRFDSCTIISTSCVVLFACSPALVMMPCGNDACGRSCQTSNGVLARRVINAKRGGQTRNMWAWHEAPVPQYKVAVRCARHTARPSRAAARAGPGPSQTNFLDWTACGRCPMPHTAGGSGCPQTHGRHSQLDGSRRQWERNQRAPVATRQGDNCLMSTGEPSRDRAVQILHSSVTHNHHTLTAHQIKLRFPRVLHCPLVCSGRPLEQRRFISNVSFLAFLFANLQFHLELHERLLLYTPNRAAGLRAELV